MLKESTEAKIKLAPYTFAMNQHGVWLKKQSGTLAGIAQQLHVSLYPTLPHTYEPTTRLPSRPTLGLNYMPFETQSWLNKVRDSTYSHSGEALPPIEV